MTFSDVIGQSLLVHRLKRIISSGRIVHAYLFSGPRGSGKKTFGSLFAKALLCESRDQRPCDRCLSCRRFVSGNHPDVVFIRLEKSSIGVDDIREMQRDIQVKPFMHGYKIYIIEEAHAMTPQAQNALLKTLEDPPEHAVLILLSDRMEGMLPTVLSRCHMLRLGRMSRKDIGLILERRLGLSPADASSFARISQGLPGKALELAQSREYRDILDKTFEFIKALGKGLTMADAVQNTFFAENRDHADEILDILLIWFRDLIVYQETQNEELIANIGKINLIKSQAGSFTTKEVQAIIEKIKECKKMLKGNANYQLAIDNMLLGMRGGENHAVGGRNPF